MGQSENGNIEYEILLHTKCERELKKLRKRAAPGLIKEIKESLDGLKQNPDLGEELSQDLAGMRSIHLNKYQFRILYEKKDNPKRQVLVLKIGYRRDFYSDFAKYRELKERTP